MYKKNILCAIIIASGAMQIAAHNEADLFPKPSKTPKTCLLTAGAGLLAGAATTFSLDQLCSFFEVTKVPFLSKIGTVFTVGPVQMFVGIRKEFSTPAPYVITACGLALGSLAAWLTYRYQPEGKFGRGHDVLTEALTDVILNDLIEAEQELLANIDDSYIHYAYPRVAAYNEFIRYHKQLTHAVKLFEEAIAHADNAEFTTLATACLDKIDQYIDDIKDCINIIRNSPDWIEQLKGHDTMLTREAHERAALAAQQIAFNTAFSNNHCRHTC